jgi:hypothetical protein
VTRSRHRSAACWRVPGELRDLRLETTAAIVVDATREMLACDSVAAIESAVSRTEQALAARGLPVPPVLRDTADMITAELLA